VQAQKEKLRALYRELDTIDHDLAIHARQIAELNEKRVAVDAQIDAMLSSPRGATTALLASAVAAVVVAAGAAQKRKLLEVVAAHPDEGYGGWAKRIYGQDSPRHRHAVRTRLEYERRQGRANREADGKWIVLPTSARSGMRTGDEQSMLVLGKTVTKEPA